MNPERTRLWLLASLAFDPLLQGCIGGGGNGDSSNQDSNSPDAHSAGGSKWYYWVRSPSDGQIYRIANEKWAEPELVPAYLPQGFINGDFKVEHDIFPSRNGQVFAVTKTHNYENKFAVGICNLPLNKSKQEFTHMLMFKGDMQRVRLSNDGRYLAVAINFDRNTGSLYYFDKVFVYDLQKISGTKYYPEPILYIDSSDPSDPNKCATFSWLPDNRLLTFNIGERVIYANSLNGEFIKLGNIPESYGEYDVSHFTDVSFDGKYLLGELKGPENIDKYGTSYNIDTWVSNIDGSNFHQATYLQMSLYPRWTPDNLIISNCKPENPEAIHTGIRPESFTFITQPDINMLTREQARNKIYDQDPIKESVLYAFISR